MSTANMDDSPICDVCKQPLTEGDLAIGATTCSDCTPASDEMVDFDQICTDSGGANLVTADVFVVHQSKPRADTYVRFMPDWVRKMPMYERSADEGMSKERYVALPHLMHNPRIRCHFRETILVFGIDTNGECFLWPIKLALDGRRDDRVRSCMTCYERGCESWVAIQWAGAKFQPLPAMGDLPAPVWPEKTQNEWLNAAFSDGRIIRGEEHEVIQQLLGKSV